ncbi:putative phosphoglycerate mutase pmu1 [Didymosphaeria variabile]|uniref:Phosphoglycerate mutase pmu1 n=1 Tax=Didymosphaeria variabile TaxID=1932322 RepID=A0A9W9CEZ7_9PLEO|nr:putative phosphoglycerate mutase pmu1 [Didymosphaeria variabile]KAJ4358477.1 putative phosphoglycerate mutase pmu1 [Didymosphaeria variabile]
MWCSTLFTSVLAAAATVQAYSVKTHVNYTVVTGIFQQDDAATDASSFNFTAQNFGLIERKYPSDGTYWGRKPTSWQRLNHYIDTLNRKARYNERYTLLFLGRHGEGYHNAAETYFGTPAWNCYWSEKDGNSTVTWADAHLTPKGVSQAQDVNRFWKKLLTTEKIAAPQTYYTSPLFRCLDTARLTFSGLPLPRKSPFVPTIKEYFREGISAHTCDRRSNKTYIHANFPTYKFERGFAEHDPYWTELHAEPSADQDIRSKKVLDDVFSNDKSTYISVTAHSGEIASLLRVLGHRVFGLSTGASIPVLVKATTIKGSGPSTTTVPYTAQKTCAAPPTITDSSCNDCSCCS